MKSSQQQNGGGMGMEAHSLPQHHPPQPQTLASGMQTLPEMQSQHMQLVGQQQQHIQAANLMLMRQREAAIMAGGGYPPHAMYGALPPQQPHMMVGGLLPPNQSPNFHPATVEIPKLVCTEKDKKARFPSFATRTTQTMKISLDKYRVTWNKVLQNQQHQPENFDPKQEIFVKQCFCKILIGERRNHDLEARLQEITEQQLQQEQQQQSVERTLQQQQLHTENGDTRSNSNTQREESSLPLIKRARYNYQQQFQT